MSYKQENTHDREFMVGLNHKDTYIWRTAINTPGWIPIKPGIFSLNMSSVTHVVKLFGNRLWT